MTYQEIKSFINTYIVQNGVNAITGSRLNTALNALADYYGFDSVVVTTLPAGSDATANMQGKTLELGIPKGADGQNGRDGLDATNPFKGWFNSLDDLKASYTAAVGDSAYVKDASPATTWSIYVYDEMATTDNNWADSGMKADTSNVQTFASGEEVNEVHIVNDMATGGEHDVLSAEQGKILNETLFGKLDMAQEESINVPNVEGGTYRNTTSDIGTGYNTSAWYTSNVARSSGFIDLTSYIRDGYRVLKVVQDPYVGGTKQSASITFVKKPSKPSTSGGVSFNNLISRGHLSSVHNAANKVCFVVEAKAGMETTTFIDIPIDATGVYFQYRNSTDAISAPEDLRKPKSIAVTGKIINGDIDDLQLDIQSLKSKITFQLQGSMYPLYAFPTEVRIKLEENKVYRIYKPAKWTNTIATVSAMFYWRRVLNGVSMEYQTAMTEEYDFVPEYFDIVAQANDYYNIGIRADAGITVNVVIEQIEISSHDIVYSFDSIKNGNIQASNGVYNDAGDSTMNQVFKFNRPTLGKKYLDLTWMILLYDAREIDRGLAWYDKDGNYISGIKLGDINVDELQRGTWQVRLPIPKNASYFNYTYWGSWSTSQYQQLQKKWKVILTDKEDAYIPTLDGNFGNFIDFTDYDGPTGDTLMLQTYSTLIQQWDALQSAHSECIEPKKLLGYGTLAGSGTAQPDNTLPIYEYVVHPIPHNDTGYEEYLTTVPKNNIKILIVTGVHGAEKPSSTSVLELVKHLVGHYQSTKYDAKIISLAQNCEYHIIPCVNPYSYDYPSSEHHSGGRDNARGVNINRNFGHNWDYQVGGDIAQKGSAPYSELETQIVRDFIQANKDALVYVDAHTTYLSSSPLQGCYNYAFDLDSRNLLNSYMKIVSIKAQEKWPNIFTQNQYIGFLGYNNQACTASEARYINSIPRVATLEININAGGLGRGNEEQMILSLNQIVNYIRMCIDWQLKRK